MTSGKPQKMNQNRKGFLVFSPLFASLKDVFSPLFFKAENFAGGFASKQNFVAAIFLSQEYKRKMMASLSRKKKGEGKEKGRKKKPSHER